MLIRIFILILMRKVILTAAHGTAELEWEKNSGEGLMVKGNLGQLLKGGIKTAVSVGVYRWKRNSKSHVKSYWQKKIQGTTEKGLVQRIQKLMAWCPEQGHL